MAKAGERTPVTGPPPVAGRRALVVGASGRSGAAAVRLLCASGATVILADRKTESEYLTPADLSGRHVIDRRPREDVALLEEERPDLVLTAPGVPLSGPLLSAAVASGIPVHGENDFAFAALRRVAPYVVLGITGTDGKSTTTALVVHLLSALGTPAVACGNFGLPLSELALQPPEASTVLVVECSSFQLEALRYFHPNAAAILNVAPDHQDRYTGHEAYLAAKLRIGELLRDGDALFVPPELLAGVRDALPGQLQRTVVVEPARAEESEGGRLWLRTVSALRLEGSHNRTNLAFALALAAHAWRLRDLSPSVPEVAAAVGSFRGLPHRMELVGEYDGLRFVNDSKATTIQAVRSALASFGEGVGLHHLLGGRSKGADFREILGTARQARRYPFGESGGQIAGVLGVSESYSGLRNALRAAVEAARKARDGTQVGGPVQTILLSPGCTSYDEFRSFEDRGDRFREMVFEIMGGRPPALSGGVPVPGAPRA